MWLARWIEPEMYVPAGNDTVPPPAELAAAMALLIAAVSAVLPSPAAPYVRTSKFTAQRGKQDKDSETERSRRGNLMRTINNTLRNAG